MPSLVEIGPVVLEKKNVKNVKSLQTDRQTDGLPIFFIVRAVSETSVFPFSVLIRSLSENALINAESIPMFVVCTYQ